MVKTFSHIFIMMNNWHLNSSQNIKCYKAKYYLNQIIQNMLLNKCKSNSHTITKFSFSAFFKTMANFWRVTLISAAPSEWPKIKNVILHFFQSLLLINVRGEMYLYTSKSKAMKSVSLCDTHTDIYTCLLYTSPSPRDGLLSRMPSSA